MKINSVVSFRGEIYTDSYGNSNAAEDSLDNDDQKVSLVSIFVGPKECEMVSDFIQFQAFSRVFRSFHEFSQVFTNFQELFHKKFGEITKDSLDNDDQKQTIFFRRYLGSFFCLVLFYAIQRVIISKVFFSKNSIFFPKKAKL
mgnify:CR=1 FL=1